MAKRYFEDFTPGEEIDLGAYRLSGAEIASFNQEFAGETDVHAPASPWHICSAVMRMMCDSFLLDAAGQGAPGIDQCTWFEPVFAGSELRGKAGILSARRLRSRPKIGVVLFRFEIRQDNDRPVLELENSIMFECRTADTVQE